MRLVQPYRRRIGRPDFEKHIHYIQSLRKLDQVFQQLAADAATTVQRRYAQVQHMRLAGASTHDAVADADVIQLDHAAVVTRPQAIAEYRLAPRKGVGLLLQLRHRHDIVETHVADQDLGYCRHAVMPPAIRRANLRSSQALRFSVGERSR